MKTYKVDLDYEASLFDLNYTEDSSSNQKIIREFEYVFFLVEKEKAILKNLKSYEKKYLDHLKSLGFVIPEFNSGATQYEYWWGHRHNREIERMLNSKLTSASLANENNWGFQEGAIVETIEQLTDHLAKYPNRSEWIINRPHSFSGIGHYQFDSHSLDESILTKILTEKVLLEPVYKRIFDIGTTFVVKNGMIQRQFMVENFNSEKGSFKGGAGSSDVNKFKKYIFEKYSYSLDDLEKTTQLIAQTYLNMGAESNIQIDSFIYSEKGELKLYPLVEVNYRKTMGLVIQSLADKFNNSKFIEWRIELAKTSLDPSWIKLSPEGNRFHSYLKQFV